MLSSKVKNTQTAEAPQAVKPPGQKGLSCLTKMHNHHCLMAHGPISSKHLPSLSHGTWPLLLQTPTIIPSEVSSPLLCMQHNPMHNPMHNHICLMARGPFSSKHLPSSPHRSAPPCSARSPKVQCQCRWHAHPLSSHSPWLPPPHASSPLHWSLQWRSTLLSGSQQMMSWRKKFQIIQTQ